MKKRIIQLTICMALLAATWGIYAIVIGKLNHRIETCIDDFSWVYQVDSVKMVDDEFVLSGFAFQLGKDAVGDEFEIVLQELETGKNYFPRMQYAERKDVNDYFLCEYDYLNSGFEARIKEKKLDLQEKNYEVLLRVKGEKKAYLTGTYLSEGQLVYAKNAKAGANDFDIKVLTEKLIDVRMLATDA